MAAKRPKKGQKGYKPPHETAINVVDSLLNVAIGLNGVWDAVAFATGVGDKKLEHFIDRLTVNYTSYDPMIRDPAREGRLLEPHIALNGWAPIAAAAARRKVGTIVKRHTPIRHNQSMFSAATSYLGRILHMVPEVVAIKAGMDAGESIPQMLSRATTNRTGVVYQNTRNVANATGNFAPGNLVLGYAPDAVAIGIKKATAVVAKGINLKSVFG